MNFTFSLGFTICNYVTIICRGNHGNHSGHCGRAISLPSQFFNASFKILLLLIIKYISAIIDFCPFWYLMYSWKDLFIHRILMLALVPNAMKNWVWRLHPRSKEYNQAVDEMFDFAKRVRISSNHIGKNYAQIFKC